jgi:hypothetical protein
MKTLALLLYFTFVTSCSGVAVANDWRNLNTLAELSGFDDTIHVAVGAGIAYLIKEHSGLTGWKLCVTMIAIPLVFGLIKEIMDKNFDYSDIIGYGVRSNCYESVNLIIDTFNFWVIVL